MPFTMRGHVLNCPQCGQLFNAPNPYRFTWIYILAFALAVAFLIYCVVSQQMESSNMINRPGPDWK